MFLYNALSEIKPWLPCENSQAGGQNRAYKKYRVKTKVEESLHSCIMQYT